MFERLIEPMGGVVEQLESALDALAAERIEGLFGPALLEREGRLVTAMNRLAAELARTTRQCELAGAPEHDGLKTMQSWLRGHGRLSPAEANQLVRNGRALAQLPAVAEAAAAGNVTPQTIAAIAPVVTPENLAAAQAQGVDVAAVDVALAEIAATRPHAELRQVVGHYLARLDPDGPEPDPTEQRALVFARHDDGRLSFRGELDAVGGEKFQAAVDSILQASRPAGDTRTRAQQSADALVQLCDIHLASGNLPILRTVKPHVMARIDLEDLVDPATGPAAGELRFGASISAARARWLACDGNVTRIVIGPQDQPIHLGRSHRVVPPPLRWAIEHRDHSCVFAGCDAPAHWCEVHHLVHWAHDGETEPENLALLCERHHTKVHHGFDVERDDQGRWHTYRPDGTEILLLPRIPDHTPRPRAG